MANAAPVGAAAWTNVGRRLFSTIRQLSRSSRAVPSVSM